MSEATTHPEPSLPGVAALTHRRVEQAVAALLVRNTSAFERDRVDAEAREALADLESAMTGLYRMFNDEARRHDATRDELRSQRDRAERIEREFETFKDHATQVLHTEADERSFCTEFDDIMERIGLARRARDYLVHTTVTLNIEVGVTATNDTDACNQVDDEKVVEAIYNLARHQLSENVGDIEPLTAFEEG